MRLLPWSGPEEGTHAPMMPDSTLSNLWSGLTAAEAIRPKEQPVAARAERTRALIRHAMTANLQPDLLDLVARDREASRVFCYHALCGVDAAITAIDAEARSKAKEQEQAERAEQPPAPTATTAPTVAEPNDSAWPTPAMLEATASFEAAVIKFLGMNAVSDNDAAEAANLTSLAKGH
jgi:hypothetical protein